MVKAVWDGHFTNISVEIWVQPSYVDGLFGLPGDLGGILIYDVKIQDGGQWMVEIFTMFKYVCSNPDILAKEMEHLNRVLHYNNYPQWIINQ